MASTTSRAALISVLVLLVLVFRPAQSVESNIMKFGAKADGASDISQAVLSAWKEACAATTPSKVVVPAGKYMVNQVVLTGPCKNHLTFSHEGTFLAPADPSKFKSGSGGDGGWVSFRNVDFFTLTGSGSFDGQGSLAWDKNQCKKTASCSSLPTNIRLDELTNSLVEKISSLNSKMFHFNVLGCKNITIRGIKITAPATSANTDGIHVARSSGVTITNPDIKTGDDCISVGDGTVNLDISGVRCGPGHGISVGSLGKFKDEKPVVGIHVRNCTLTGTMWGVRIKTWPASPASTASDMHFEDITMKDVINPVLIDQQYCPWNQCKGQIPSKVKLSNVSFKNIAGTSTTQNVVKLACSSGVPCDKVVMENIKLAYNGKDGAATSVCTNVKPTITGQVPKGCSA